MRMLRGQGRAFAPAVRCISKSWTKTGDRLPDGQAGELVATTIGVEAMPLVRFATGDITFMTHQRALRTMDAADRADSWRKDQAMKIKGTTVYPAAVQRALHGIEQIADYVMIATAPTALSDELEVVVAWRGFDRGRGIDSGDATRAIESFAQGENMRPRGTGSAGGFTRIEKAACVFGSAEFGAVITLTTPPLSSRNGLADVGQGCGASKVT